MKKSRLIIAAIVLAAGFCFNSCASHKGGCGYWGQMDVEVEEIMSKEELCS